MIWLAVLAAGGAAACAWPSSSWLARERLGIGRSWSWHAPARPGRLGAAGVLVGLALFLVRLDGTHVVVGVAAAVGAATAGRLALTGRARAGAAARRAESVEVVSLLASELRAGALGDAAIRSVAGETTVIDAAARAAVQGTDVVPALREVGAAPGAELWTEVAAAWWVADRAGAPLAAVLTRLADRSRDDLDLAVEVTAELGPARATARLMALLPAFGLLLGAGMGGNPVEVLLDTPLGAGCLLAGVLLACTGLMWIERVAAGVDAS